MCAPLAGPCPWLGQLTLLAAATVPQVARGEQAEAQRVWLARGQAYVAGRRARRALPVVRELLAVRLPVPDDVQELIVEQLAAVKVQSLYRGYRARRRQQLCMWQYVVEYQSRGMLHVHVLYSLNGDAAHGTSAAVDVPGGVGTSHASMSNVPMEEMEEVD